MENQKSFPFGNDIFANAFEEFDESTFFQRLEERVKPQSYYHKNKGLKNTVLALSYLFNLFSMITASYLIFSLVKWLTGITLLAYFLVGIFLFFLEKLKRKSSNEFFQVWFFSKKLAVGWLTLSLALFAGSVVSTYFGTDKATKDFAPAAIIIQDSTITYLQQELVFLQQENERLKQWKNHEGKVYWDSAKERTIEYGTDE